MGPSDLGKLVGSNQGRVMGIRHDSMREVKLGRLKTGIDFTVYMQKLTLHYKNSQELTSVTTNVLAGFHQKSFSTAFSSYQSHWDVDVWWRDP